MHEVSESLEEVEIEIFYSSSSSASAKLEVNYSNLLPVDAQSLSISQWWRIQNVLSKEMLYHVTFYFMQYVTITCYIVVKLLSFIFKVLGTERTKTCTYCASNYYVYILIYHFKQEATIKNAQNSNYWCPIVLIIIVCNSIVLLLFNVHATRLCIILANSALLLF